MPVCNLIQNLHLNQLLHILRGLHLIAVGNVLQCHSPHVGGQIRSTPLVVLALPSNIVLIIVEQLYCDLVHRRVQAENCLQ